LITRVARVARIVWVRGRARSIRAGITRIARITRIRVHIGIPTIILFRFAFGFVLFILASRTIVTFTTVFVTGHFLIYNIELY
jgi:hypothetical protein